VVKASAVACSGRVQNLSRGALATHGPFCGVAVGREIVGLTAVAGHLAVLDSFAVRQRTR
jgi:hypothetical protein